MPTECGAQTGNFAITADVRFIGKGVEEHRKAVLVVRQSLNPNAPYAVSLPRTVPKRLLRPVRFEPVELRL